MMLDFKFQEACQTVRARAGIYETLARGFLKEPDSSFATRLGELLEILRPLLDLDLILEDCYIYDQELLTQEYYDRIFVPSSGKYVPPFESAIVGRMAAGDILSYGPLNGSETRHVLACYRSVGFNHEELEIFKPVRYLRLADYLGFELAFAAYLCYAQAGEDRSEAAHYKWQELQKIFIEQHLGRWCKDYASLVEIAAPGFYVVLSKLAAAWVVYDLNSELQGKGD
ncbi:MAG: molecular chaperone TorD family protein [Bacillota bacterium]